VIKTSCQGQLGCGIERTGGWLLPPLRPSRWVRGGSLVKVGSASLPTGSAARCACACVCSDGGGALIDQAQCPIVRARRISGNRCSPLNEALRASVRALSCGREPAALPGGIGMWYPESRRVALTTSPALRLGQRRITTDRRIRLEPHRIITTMRTRMCVLRWRPCPIERARCPTVRARRGAGATSQSLNGTLTCTR
jgi:hypothetical protein